MARPGMPRRVGVGTAPAVGRMTVHAGYDDIGNKCLGHAQPGTEHLRDAIIDRFGGSSLGVYVCRTQHGSSNLSAHGEGRAYDHAWTDQATGQAIADELVAHNADLGLQVVIWWHRIWSYTKGWHAYTGPDPHTGHLHIEHNWSGANDLTYAAAKAALTPHHPQPQPEDSDMPKYVYSVPGVNGEFLTDGVTTHTLSLEALTHGKNRGWYVDAAPKDMDPAEHAWLVSNTKGQNVP